MVPKRGAGKELAYDAPAGSPGLGVAAPRAARTRPKRRHPASVGANPRSRGGSPGGAPKSSGLAPAGLSAASPAPSSHHPLASYSRGSLREGSSTSSSSSCWSFLLFFDLLFSLDVCGACTHEHGCISRNCLYYCLRSYDYCFRSYGAFFRVWCPSIFKAGVAAGQIHPMTGLPRRFATPSNMRARDQSVELETMKRILQAVRLEHSHSSGRRGPRATFFSIQTAKFGSVAPPVSRFHPDLGLHPSGEPTSSPIPRGALGDSERNESARNVEKFLSRFRLGFAAEMDPASQRHTHRLPRVVKAAADQLAADASHSTRH